MVIIEDKLSLLRYNVDSDGHIKVDTSVCRSCPHQACVYVCPAGCYKLQDGELLFGYEGCLECGSCNIICDQGAVDWNYPRGGFGVSFRFT